MTEKEIRDLFASKSVPLGRDDVWKVQSALVIKHAALERLAAEIGIRFDPPTILRSERDEAVILTVGHLGEASEWSIGEALIGSNYRVSGKQAAYVWAMAEKRAKDRVILKLAKLHGAYSEDEADDFKPGKADAPEESEEQEDDRSSSQIMADEMIAFISSRPTADRINRFIASADYRRDFDLLDNDDQVRVMEATSIRLTAIAAGLVNLQAG